MLDLAATERALVADTVGFPLRRDVVVVSGPDAVSYLQGQLSQDVAGMAVGETRASLLLQPQGKIDAWGRLSRIADTTFWYDVEPGHGEATAARLQRFLLRVDVTVEAAERPVLAVRGPGSATVRPDTAGDEVVVLDPVWPGVDGFDLLHPDPRQRPAWPVGLREGHADGLESLRISLGLPAMGRELDGSTIPAAAGVVPVSVSFTKGCFVGQELVARIDSRGAATPTHLVAVRFGAEPSDPVGSSLVVDGAEVGSVTSFAPSHRWGPVGLAWFKRGAAAGPVRVVSGSGTGAPVLAEVVELPLDPADG